MSRIRKVFVLVLLALAAILAAPGTVPSTLDEVVLLADGVPPPPPCPPFCPR